MKSFFKIETKLKNSLGRAAEIDTPHGIIKTPAFVPVGTKGTIKSLTPEQVKSAKSQVILANTYHLYLQPGDEIVKKSGGLGKFMNWNGPTMTDSGGFQAFSLGVAYGHDLGKFISHETLSKEITGEINKKTRPKDNKQTNSNAKAKVTEEGVEFKSIIDGSKHFISPEKSINIQNNLGADIIFALDEFTSPYADKNILKETVDRTYRWAKRSLMEHKRLDKQENQSIFGIVQGGKYEDLRKKSAREISKLDFGGFGIGGTFVKEDMATAVRWVNEILPEDKPRHLLGVGEPLDLFLAVENGCDTFDCVAPTRIARNGGLYTKNSKINITNSKYKNIFKPIEMDCGCYTCKNYTTAYIAHLFRAGEMLAATLATIHNLYFINDLVEKIRQSILDNNFFEFKEEFGKTYHVR